MLFLSDQWISPVVSGDCPPPCRDFTLTALTDNTFITFGGCIPNGRTNSLYIVHCTESVLVSIVYYKSYYRCGSFNQ